MTDTQMLAEQTAFRTVDIAPLIGARVQADSRTLLGGSHAQDIRDLLETRGVVFFPQVNLTEDEQVAFTKTVGTYVSELDGRESVFRVSLDPKKNSYAEYFKESFFWHLDGTMEPLPIRATVLTAQSLSVEGGDTEIANTYAAYEAVSDEDKALIENLRVRHTLEALHSSIYPKPSYAQLTEWRRHAHKTLPLVWKHESGRKSLVIGNSAGFVEGMDRDESTLLLARLLDHATQPQFVYRHQWRVGDMLIWDNCGTLHRALPYPADSGRLMHRTKLKGEEAFA